jgi:hypothetical protein
VSLKIYWNLGKLLSVYPSTEDRCRASEWPPSGLTATRVGQTVSLCFRVVWPLPRPVRPPTPPMIRFWIWKLTLQLWQSDRELNYGPTAKCTESFQRLVFGVWAINTHPSHTRYLSWPFKLHTWLLRSLSFLTQAFLDPLWVCEMLDSSVLELCGTSDSSSKHLRLVTLGGCRLLDGLEE